jgi:hypothetical protein
MRTEGSTFSLPTGEKQSRLPHPPGPASGDCVRGKSRTLRRAAVFRHTAAPGIPLATAPSESWRIDATDE